ncbi:nucleotidyl transferase AbiEii/AbiGii toxin family protein [Agrobacterium tumefaciens]|uniref:nucleotidyl transferase AbiEii/AbiGii toxin family protein n=1 Tax=Agrobacterium tumefaciens TaxID=358 RepID=UPI003BA12D72
MPSQPDYLHNHRDFLDLLRIVAAEQGIAVELVEKDYWIMHCLYGLQKLGMKFELKGGTSLSKGYKIIHRFSEDIDIRIDPPADRKVSTNPKQQNDKQVESRRAFYDWLATQIEIDGINEVVRDTAFDDPDYYRGGGIRLRYREVAGHAADLKEGILLEVGFDDVAPNSAIDISSWAYDYASTKTRLLDNRALGVACYSPGYTLVEKLQTISTKYRQQQESGKFPLNFMRHYYDVGALLAVPSVLDFLGTEAYYDHKKKRFRKGDDHNIVANPAFVLAEPQTRKLYETAYDRSASLYYQERPTLSEILALIARHADRL